MVTKEELAQAVAACDLDPVVVRSEGKEGLFAEQYYTKVFPTSDPLFYLARYRLMHEVRYASAGYPERAYTKWADPALRLVTTCSIASRPLKDDDFSACMRGKSRATEVATGSE